MLDFGFGVTLGPLDSAHKETIRQWRNHPRIRRWCRQTGLISDLDQEAWFSRQAADPSISMFGIFHDDKLVGVCGLTSIDHLNRRAEFSLYIAPTFHGNGYGESALETLVTHGFVDLNLNCIWGESFEGNRAQNTFKTLGFKHEGTRRQFYFKDGKYVDADLYSILAKEWKWPRV